MSTDVVIPETELPDWMRQAQRGVDWGVLITIGLSLILAWPLLLGNGLPRSNHMEAYLFQASDMVTAIEEGWLYPRWSPHAQAGFGAPASSFYPPAVPYTTALINILLVNDLPTAMAYLLIAGFVIAGCGTYVLVTQHAGAKAGILAAMLYLFNPYIGITLPHIIGDPAQSLAAAVLPALLWSFNRLIYANRQLDWAITTIFFAALILTDPRYFFAGLLLSTAFSLFESRGLASRRNIMFRGLSAAVIGALLTSFYWLPALLEQAYITWQTTSKVGPVITLNLTDLLQPAEYIDPLILNPLPQMSLGAAIIVMVLASLGAILYRREINTQGFFILAGLLLLISTLIFFPGESWLLSPVLLCLAIGGSYIIGISPNDTDLQRMIFGSSVIFLGITSLPAWFSQYRGADLGLYTPEAQVRYEQQGFGVAVLPPDAALPSALPLDYEINRDLINQYAQGEINRFGQELFARNQASLLSSSSQTLRFALRSRELSTATILIAYFPGWQASLNGRSIPLREDPETGLIIIDLPADSRGELEISFGTSLVRQNAWVLSFTALALLIAYTARRWRLQNRRYYDTSQLLNISDSRFLLLIIGCIAAITAASNLRILPLALRPDPGQSLSDVTALAFRTETGLEMLAYQIDNTQVNAGSPLRIDLYWQSLQFLPDNLQSSVQMRNAETGLILASSQTRHIGYYPTRRWPRGATVLDRHILLPDGDIPPGRYIIEVELLRCGALCDDRIRLQFFNREGQSAGSLLTLPQIISIQ